MFLSNLPTINGLFVGRIGEEVSFFDKIISFFAIFVESLVLHPRSNGTEILLLWERYGWGYKQFRLLIRFLATYTLLLTSFC